ncbi:MAG: AraC family ligand binding domain-containing protein, partial [Leclercia adecarboxylata]|nr:AraC family ligand binding domain-containing protein [Leclercia adecarboxylata]
MNTLTVAHYFKSTDDKLALYKSDPEDNSCEHCHEFDELVIVEQGHGLHIINGRPLYIQQGDIFYVQRGDHHFYDELGTLKLINILINPVAEFVFLQHTGSLLQRFSVRDASCYTWLAPEIRMQCNSL